MIKLFNVAIKESLVQNTSSDIEDLKYVNNKKIEKYFYPFQNVFNSYEAELDIFHQFKKKNQLLDFYSHY